MRRIVSFVIFGLLLFGVVSKPLSNVNNNLTVNERIGKRNAAYYNAGTLSFLEGTVDLVVSVPYGTFTYEKNGYFKSSDFQFLSGVTYRFFFEMTGQYEISDPQMIQYGIEILEVKPGGYEVYGQFEGEQLVTDLVKDMSSGTFYWEYVFARDVHACLLFYSDFSYFHTLPYVIIYVDSVDESQWIIENGGSTTFYSDVLEPKPLSVFLARIKLWSSYAGLLTYDVVEDNYTAKMNIIGEYSVKLRGGTGDNVSVLNILIIVKNFKPSIVLKSGASDSVTISWASYVDPATLKNRFTGKNAEGEALEVVLLEDNYTKNSYKVGNHIVKYAVIDNGYTVTANLNFMVLDDSVPFYVIDNEVHVQVGELLEKSNFVNMIRQMPNGYDYLAFNVITDTYTAKYDKIGHVGEVVIEAVRIDGREPVMYSFTVRVEENTKGESGGNYLNYIMANYPIWFWSGVVIFVGLSALVLYLMFRKKDK